ncbi:MAG: type I-E CRISPR-associated protein Cas5/CasD [Chloroflexi bacterium]|nr:type I-E CRISPR-associated protein Cas5/CasD [Chloroflexota bacterium]
MPTLLIRLCGPMQSWGTRSRFTERDTELEPSKSGVVGIICAALGRPRSEDVSDLAALRMGVRVDHEGTMANDYHTAGGVDGVARASGGISKNSVLSNRYYLAGADFLVGLESEDGGFLRELEDALRAPRWQLSLGRKSFLPSVPIYLPGPGGVRALVLWEALTREPWPLRPLAWRPPREMAARPLRLVLETDFSGPVRPETRNDQPLGAAFRDRTFGLRAIVQEFFEKEQNDVPQPPHA